MEKQNQKINHIHKNYNINYHINDNKENDVNVDTIVSKALTMYGVMGEMDIMAGALKILEEHKPDLTPIITDELPFDDCIKGFTRTNYPNAIKIAVKINRYFNHCRES